MWNLRGIFVSGMYMAVTSEVYTAVAFVLAHICKNVGSICSHCIITVWFYLEKWQPYLFIDISNMHTMTGSRGLVHIHADRHIYMHTYTYRLICIWLYIYPHLCIHIFMHELCMTTYILTYIHIYTCLHVYIHIYMDTAYMFGCTYTYMYAYVTGISMIPLSEFQYFGRKILHYSIMMMSLHYIANDVISLS